jgi:hypothetical protein
MGHAICLVIARDAGLGATGSLTVCNSGAGIHQYHPSSASFYPTTKYRTAMHLGGIPWHKLCSDATAYLLLAPMVRELHTPDESSTPDRGKHWSLYEAALPHLAPEGAVEAAIQRSEQEGLHGEWETPQRSGMCYLRGSMTGVRYLLHRRLGIPGEELGDGFVDERPERLGACLVAPHQGLVARLHDSRKLPLPAAAGKRERHRQPGRKEERATQHGTAPAEERVGLDARGEIGAHRFPGSHRRGRR